MVVLYGSRRLLVWVYSEPLAAAGRWWSRSTLSGPGQTQLDLALNPDWGNLVTRLVEIRVPAGTTIYEGFAAPQEIRGGGTLLGGGAQGYIPEVESKWIVRDLRL
jgi:hypothetical protein